MGNTQTGVSSCNESSKWMSSETPRSIEAYPAHVFGGLLTSPPWTSGTINPDSRIQSWYLLVSRGMDSAYCLEHAERDVARSLGAPLSHVRGWMRTPLSVGGAGSFPSLFHSNRSWFKLERTSKSVDVVEKLDKILGTKEL